MAFRICLNTPADGETKCPQAAVEAAGVPFEILPMGPPNWTDREVGIFLRVSLFGRLLWSLKRSCGGLVRQ